MHINYLLAAGAAIAGGYLYHHIQENKLDNQYQQIIKKYGMIEEGDLLILQDETKLLALKNDESSVEVCTLLSSLRVHDPKKALKLLNFLRDANRANHYKFFDKTTRKAFGFYAGEKGIITSNPEYHDEIFKYLVIKNNKIQLRKGAPQELNNLPIIGRHLDSTIRPGDSKRGFLVHND